MRSSSSASARLSSPNVLSPRTGVVDAALELLMIRKDFHNAFEMCEKGLESLVNLDEQEETSSRHGELKSALCIVGIQAMAELNQWCNVLPWVLQHYGEAKKIPAKIMQMCILLYTKVGEQTEMQEVVQNWLHCSSNMSQLGYNCVAELYILHVLLPLSQTAEARDLLEGEVGRVAFTEDQRQTAIVIVENHDAKTKPSLYPTPECVSLEHEGRVNTPQGVLDQRLNAVVRLLYRGLSAAASNIRFHFPRRAFLFLFLLYLLLIRMDPALPSAYLWILRLCGLFQQMWNTMFGPYYRAFR